MSIIDLEDSKSFKNKVLTADVFENDNKNILKRLWANAEEIEITLDFLEPHSFLNRKINQLFGKIFKV